MKSTSFIAAILVVIFLSACAQFNALSAVNEPLAKEEKPIISDPWWRNFGDPLLDKLAEDLLAQNLDIKIAIQRVREARSLEQAVVGEFFPQINATGNIYRGNSQVGMNKSASIAKGGFDASWELDIFGRNSAKLNAAQQNLYGSEARLEDVSNSIIAELVLAFVNFRITEKKRAEISSLLETQDLQIKLLSARENAGLIDKITLTRALAERSKTSANLPFIQAESDSSIYKIERIMGTDSGKIQKLFSENTGDLTVPNPEKIIDVNLDKMRSRPDVRAARSEMLSAKAGLELAEANLWPKLSLRSFFGVQEISNGMIEAGNPIWSLAADISAPVLNFGVLRGAKNAADANSQAAIFVYEKAVLTALQEASTSLSDFLNSVNALEDQEKTIQHRGETIDLARKRYESGLTDMSDLVAAQSDLKRTNLERIDIKLKALQAYIRLQKSLGLGVGKKI